MWEEPFAEIIAYVDLKAEEGDTIVMWLGKAVEAVLSVVCDFARRVVEPLCWQFPSRKFWLVVSPHDQPCPCRGRVAVEILRRDDITDDSTLKLRRHWLSDLVLCANEGVCSLKFYTYLCDVAAMSKMSTRDIEGANSTIKWMGKIAPNMAFALMSARHVAKKHLNEELPADPRYDLNGACRQRLVEACVDHQRKATE